MIDEQWIAPLLKCSEGLYIVEENSKKIIWASQFLTDGLNHACVGEACWSVFLKRDSPCPFCPALSELDELYIWDYYEPNSKRWMKVNNLLFDRNGVLYRAGSVTMIDDVMLLNYDTLQQVISLENVLLEKKDEMDFLTHEAINDPLTNLFNRNCFQRDLEKLFVNSAELGVLYFDLNNLKETNDNYRHAAGDSLLIRLAEVMRLVNVQIKKARCYRIGGDEFIMLIPHTTNEELDYATSLFNTYLEAHNEGEMHVCSVALGRAYSAVACDAELLITSADRDMYRCKRKMKAVEA